MMKPVKVHREFWELRELDDAIKFRNPTDKRRVIIAGQLRLSMWFRRELNPVELHGGLPMMDPQPVAVDRWLWPVQEGAERVDTHDYVYALLRSTRDPCDEAEYFAMPEPMTLSQVMEIAVVHDSDVQSFIASQKDQSEVSGDLSAQKENTRDRIITGLVAYHYGCPVGNERAEGLTEILNNLEEAGHPMAYNTLKDHIELAWKRAPPRPVMA